VRLLDGRIVGEVNYLNEQELKSVETKELTMREFIDYTIDNVAIQLGLPPPIKASSG